MLLPSRAVCTAARCLRNCALLGSALAFEERAVSTKKIARIGWAKKYNVSHFGFKVHAVVDDASKMILSYSRTAAQRHDVNLLVPLGSDAHKRFGLHTLMADSGYISAEREAILDQEGVTLCVISRNGRSYLSQRQENKTLR